MSELSRHRQGVVWVFVVGVSLITKDIENNLVFWTRVFGGSSEGGVVDRVTDLGVTCMCPGTDLVSDHCRYPGGTDSVWLTPGLRDLSLMGPFPPIYL